MGRAWILIRSRLARCCGSSKGVSFDERRPQAIDARLKPSEALAAHRDELRQLVSRCSVTHPRVYGSVLTGADDEDSDLDLLVDPTERTTLFTFAGLEHEAQQLLRVHVSV